MNYKALITDFDNTLADHTAKATPKVIKKIQELVEKNIIISIATGRAFQGAVDEMCQTLHLKHPQIVQGGAEIVDPITQKVLWSRYIPDHEARALMDYLIEKDIPFGIDIGDTIYTSDGGGIGTEVEDPKCRPIEEFNGDHIAKIIIFAPRVKYDAQQALDLAEELRNLFMNLHVTAASFGGYFGVDITYEGASKHTALLQLITMLDLKREEVVAVGDGYNDFPLLTAAGFKVAMANAPQDLKAIADFVAPTQAEDGLVKVIEKCF